MTTAATGGATAATESAATGAGPFDDDPAGVAMAEAEAFRAALEAGMTAGCLVTYGPPELVTTGPDDPEAVHVVVRLHVVTPLGPRAVLVSLAPVGDW
jgi:hypothetical protein